MKKLFYFGCIGDKGHYFWENEGFHMSWKEEQKVAEIIPCKNYNEVDGNFAPKKTCDQGKYLEYVFPNNTRLVSWWDRTVDSRHGSNSTLIGVGYNSSDEMLNDAVKLFPSVMNRQSRPILWNSKE